MKNNLNALNFKEGNKAIQYEKQQKEQNLTMHLILHKIKDEN